MRTSTVIDDKRLPRATQAHRFKTQRAAVHAGSRLFLGSLLGMLCLSVWAQRALDKDTSEAVLRIPATAKDAYGKELSGDIIVTTFRPPGPGPFPLVVISHGRDTNTRAQYERQRYESASRYFLRKGFAVAVPLRLGYGETAALGDPEDNMGW